MSGFFEKESLIHHELDSISFSLYTKSELKKLCITKIVTPLTVDALGHPLPGGLYDKRMGPMTDKSEPCGTCGKNVFHCRGHFGYIDLPLPVVNPLFHKYLGTIFKVCCLACCRFQFPAHVMYSTRLQMKLLNCGLIIEAMEVAVKTQERYANNKGACTMDSLQGDEEFKEYEQLAEEIWAQLDGKPVMVKNKETLINDIISDLFREYKAGKNCTYCKQPLQKIQMEGNRMILTNRKSDKKESKYLLPDESRRYMRELWENHPDMMKCVLPVLETIHGDESPVDSLYFDMFPVVPPLCRPASIVANQMSEHPQTHGLKSVIQNAVLLNIVIKVVKNKGNISVLTSEEKGAYEVSRGKTAVEKMISVWQDLQNSVDGIYDRPAQYRADGIGLKQMIEKKEGIIRMHMMGKRVNYAARSVITPDPNINIDEVGIPEEFAKTLTYPTAVTPWNVEQLRKVVMNGPNVYPGANLIEMEDGTVKRINPADAIQREGIAKTLLTPDIKGSLGVKKVHRHMRNGDVVLLNRQPTLHRPSIMAHKVRVLRGEKVLRLHYANCKAYNADFDGDEMNVHFPQTEMARSEAYNLMLVGNHYLVPKDGTPLSGLIQDHIIAAVHLSLRGRFFTKYEYDDLLYKALFDKVSNIEVLPPAILKPKKMWSGKQVISSVIINLIPKGMGFINMTSTSKISAKAWQTAKPREWLAGGTPFRHPNDMSEAQVIFRNGEMLVGVLDKAHCGATPYGLIHCFHELYGGTCALRLLSAFSKLFTAFVRKRGFTLSMGDILVTAEAEAQRKNIIKKLQKKGPEALAAALDLPKKTPSVELAAAAERALASNPEFRNIVDREYKSLLARYTDKINKTCMPDGLLTKFPQNNLQLMVQSGAKGSTVNTMQISCLLGQIELEGKRPPVMINGKSLPSFPTFELSPRAGGFIDGRFMTGIKPQEFFFHCMAGREGLIDTAVKTSRSGYLQRCLVKHLEGLHVAYDMTVRDSDQSVIQFLYGEDGMDVSKVQFLNEKQLPFLEENIDIVMDKEVLKQFKDDDRVQDVDEHKQELEKWRAKFGEPIRRQRQSPFTKFSEVVSQKFRSKGANSDTIRRAWGQADDQIKKKFENECLRCPDPVNSIYRPDHHFGSISEKQQELIDKYAADKPKKRQRKLMNMFNLKASQSLCPPGEPVGLLAAQSIGEPSTQMTLNTFHFAGRGEMNVTLGIPRLREILMMASKNIKTPSMEIPFLDVADVEMEAEHLRRNFTKVVMADVLEKIDVSVDLELEPIRQHKYTLQFRFLPHELYKKKYKVRPKGIIKHLTKKFLQEMFTAIRKLTKSQTHVILVEDEKKSKKVNRGGGGDDEDNEDAGNAVEKADNANSESSDEEPEDADDAKTGYKYRQTRDDQEPEEEEQQEMNESDNEDEINDEEENDDQTKTAAEVDNEEYKVVNSYNFVQKYSYDKKHHLWCEVIFALPITVPRIHLGDLLKEVANKSILWEVPQIKKAITYMKNDKMMLRTDGVNILEMCKYSHVLDLNKLYCNDVHHVAMTYGIEAARKVIVKEVQDVFAVYGITVDPRHLLLISDYMTFNGSYEALNRKGMEGSASPFQQVSFESHLTFLKKAVIGGKRDELTNPSASLMVGKPSKIGTNLIDVFTPIAPDLKL